MQYSVGHFGAAEYKWTLVKDISHWFTSESVFIMDFLFTTIYHLALLTQALRMAIDEISSCTVIYKCYIQ